MLTLRRKGVIALPPASVTAFDGNFEVGLDSLREEDPLQKWVVDESGRITPLTQSGFSLASTGKNSRTSRRHGVGIRVAANATAEVKTRQDQTFTFQIVLFTGEVWTTIDGGVVIM